MRPSGTSSPPCIVCIIGPTGSGKTGLAIRLARQFNAEIVGADSMQIYRRMDIGTAKPTPAERAAVPHHMIDIVEPDDDFDAAAYARMASGVIHEIIARQRVVFVVGGTGLYIKALVHGLFSQGTSDPAIRRRLKQRAKTEGLAALHQRLRQVDEQAAAKIHPNDTHRVIRALEVFEMTGESITAVHQRHRFRQHRFITLSMGPDWPRSALYERINRRVDAMMAMGFLDEVRQLLDAGYGGDLKSMQSLGYRHLTEVVQGRQQLADAVALIKRDHRRYAKRQLTWFRADPAVQWVPPDRASEAAEYIRDFLAQQRGPD